MADRAGTPYVRSVTSRSSGTRVHAWAQARLSDTWEGRRLVRTGLVIVLAGIAGMVLVLQPAVPSGGAASQQGCAIGFEAVGGSLKPWPPESFYPHTERAPISRPAA